MNYDDWKNTEPQSYEDDERDRCDWDDDDPNDEGDAPDPLEHDSWIDDEDDIEDEDEPEHWRTHADRKNP